MSFIPTDTLGVTGTHLDQTGGYTVLEKFDSHEKATASLRQGLGIRFGDYFSLGSMTVLTEGKSDVALLSWFLGESRDWEGCAWGYLRQATLADRGGCSELASFVRSTFEILRNEQPIVCLFDGDEAGVKAVSSLSRRFSNLGISFNSNREYVYVRNGFSIEGLFPDEWMIEE